MFYSFVGVYYFFLLMLIFIFYPFFNEKSTFLSNSACKLPKFASLHIIIQILQFLSVRIILEHHPEIKCIVSIPKRYTNPQIATFWVFQSDSVPSRTIQSFNNSFSMICRYFGGSKYFTILCNKGNGYYLIFLDYFHTTLPNHLLPVIEIEPFAAGQWGNFKYCYAFGFVAVHYFRGVYHCFLFII